MEQNFYTFLMRRYPGCTPERACDIIFVLRNIYDKSETRMFYQPNDPEANRTSRESSMGPDYWEYVGLWQTYCQSRGVDPKEPPPEDYTLLPG